ncbi:uncharacterized protein LOC113512701 isoform X1 [Galleria mellonella]|uniref:Uncharacterized protein LOC113512701 isoform X1 n=1 Tax=Galleria mellonella TaxID=7137 RepID=A0ABM3N709_GALME|nr:uncharacterized protein LOC113512701 isoform X1 [Galleria mellonella]
MRMKRQISHCTSTKVYVKGKVTVFILTHYKHKYQVNQQNYVTRAISRKRSREDDACEFMPLSKRINNLHINNNLANTPVSQNQDHTRINGISTENGIASPHSSTTDCERRPSYDPGVSSSESSYYYENKLLFELHLERIQRSGQQFPF